MIDDFTLLRKNLSSYKNLLKHIYICIYLYGYIYTYGVSTQSSFPIKRFKRNPITIAPEREANVILFLIELVAQWLDQFSCHYTGRATQLSTISPPFLDVSLRKPSAVHDLHIPSTHMECMWGIYTLYTKHTPTHTPDTRQTHHLYIPSWRPTQFTQIPNTLDFSVAIVEQQLEASHATFAHYKALSWLILNAILWIVAWISYSRIACVVFNAFSTPWNGSHLYDNTVCSAKACLQWYDIISMLYILDKCCV